MPPSQWSRTKNSARIDLAVLDALTVPELRNLCREKKLDSTGSRNTLMNRLRDSDVIFPAPNDERTQNQPAQGDQKFQRPPPPPPPPPDTCNLLFPESDQRASFPQYMVTKLIFQLGALEYRITDYL